MKTNKSKVRIYMFEIVKNKENYVLKCFNGYLNFKFDNYDDAYNSKILCEEVSKFWKIKISDLEIKVNILEKQIANLQGY